MNVNAVKQPSTPTSLRTKSPRSVGERDEEGEKEKSSEAEKKIMTLQELEDMRTPPLSPTMESQQNTSGGQERSTRVDSLKISEKDRPRAQSGAATHALPRSRTTMSSMMVTGDSFDDIALQIKRKKHDDVMAVRRSIQRRFFNNIPSIHDIIYELRSRQSALAVLLLLRLWFLLFLIILI